MVYRYGLASPLAFADWTQPTIAEMNAWNTGGTFNNPSGLIWNLTCALNPDATELSIDDPDRDESASFCQKAGQGDVMTENATAVFEFYRSKGRWMDASSTTKAATPEGDGFNTSELALSLLAWRDVEFFAWKSIGKGPEEPFVAGDRVSLFRVATDYGIDVIGTGENARMSQTFGFRSDILHNFVLTD